MADKPRDTPEPNSHSELSDENKRFLESDLAKQVAASPEFREMLEDQRRVRNLFKGASEKAKDIREQA